MAELTLEQVLGYMNMDPKEIDSAEKFQSTFDSNFFTEKKIFSDPEISKRIFGRVTGSITTGVKQMFDKAGIEITGDDLKNTPEKVVEIGLSRLGEFHETKRKEYETQAGLSADERLKEATTKAEKYAAKVKELEAVVSNKANEFKAELEKKDGEVKNFKLGSVKRDTETSLKYLPDLDPYKKKGFLSEMNEKYAIDFEADDTPFIVNRADGKRIPSGKSHDTFLSPREVYEMEAAKAGVIVVNQKAGTVVTKPVTQTQSQTTTQQTTQPRQGRQIASSAAI